MLFAPINFHGIKVPGLKLLFPFLPRRVQVIPAITSDGRFGWQGIVPSRAEKMASIAVDKSLAKVGSIADFYRVLDPDSIAEHLVNISRSEVRGVVTRIMTAENPQLWHNLPTSVKESRLPQSGGRSAGQRAHDHRPHRRGHRRVHRREADGDPLPLFAPQTAQRHLPHDGQQRAQVHAELRLLLRIPDGLRARRNPPSGSAVVGASHRRGDHRIHRELPRHHDDLRADHPQPLGAVEAGALPEATHRDHRRVRKKPSPITS